MDVRNNKIGTPSFVAPTTGKTQQSGGNQSTQNAGGATSPSDQVVLTGNKNVNKTANVGDAKKLEERACMILGAAYQFAQSRQG